jgi:hypothetical protein
MAELLGLSLNASGVGAAGTVIMGVSRGDRKLFTIPW